MESSRHYLGSFCFHDDLPPNHVRNWQCSVVVRADVIWDIIDTKSSHFIKTELRQSTLERNSSSRWPSEVFRNWKDFHTQSWKLRLKNMRDTSGNHATSDLCDCATNKIWIRETYHQFAIILYVLLLRVITFVASSAHILPSEQSKPDEKCRWLHLTSLLREPHTKQTDRCLHRDCMDYSHCKLATASQIMLIICC